MNVISRVIAGFAVLLYLVTLINVAAAQNAGSATPPATAPQMAAAFAVKDLNGTTQALDKYLAAGNFVVLEWFNPDCPYVKKYHAPGTANKSHDEALAFARAQDVVWLMVNSNAPGKQGSGSERNTAAVAEYSIDVPLILDESGEIGQAYGATSTPQIFLISPQGEILYNGGIDDTKLDTDVPGVNYVVNAIRQAKAGKPVDPAKTPHPGCSVKYPEPPAAAAAPPA